MCVGFATEMSAPEVRIALQGRCGRMVSRCSQEARAHSSQPRGGFGTECAIAVVQLQGVRTLSSDRRCVEQVRNKHSSSHSLKVASQHHASRSRCGPPVSGAASRVMGGGRSRSRITARLAQGPACCSDKTKSGRRAACDRCGQHVVKCPG